MRHRLWAMALVVGLAQAAPLRSTVKDRQALAITVYGGDLALVKDTRQVELPAGPAQLQLQDLSAQLRPETALLRVARGRPLRLLEQSFDWQPLTPATLLASYVGRQVRVLRSNPVTGADFSETATVLAASDGVVLRIGDRIETGVPGRLVFDAVPQALRARPTLALSLDSAGAGPRTLELSYLTGGISWQADYVAELAADEKTLALSGYLTLSNRSGAAYRDARLQLVAGDLHRAAPQRGMLMAPQAAKVAAVAQESLLDYHLYTLGRPITLADQQTKQVALLGAAAVPVRKDYRLRGAAHAYAAPAGADAAAAKVAVLLWLDNAPGAGLGLPLPAGVVRVYQRDARGDLQWVGEDRIEHTPPKQSLQLELGAAVDVTARSRQTDFKALAVGPDGRPHFESAHEIALENARARPVTVTVLEPIPGDWQVLESNLPPDKADAHTARWRVTVPAGGGQTLRYRVRVRL